MHSQTFAFVLFGILICMVVVWFALCKLLFNRLERAHPLKYADMGRPSLVLRNNISNNLSFLRLLARREYLALNDSYITKLCGFMRVYFAVYVLLFIALVVVALQIPPSSAA